MAESHAKTQPTTSARPAVDSRAATIWGAWIGVAGMLLTGAAGGVEALLGPWPSGSDPDFAGFLREGAGLILAQSLLFVFGAAAYIWFLGFIRARLLRAEGGQGTFSAIAFGAGVLTFGMIIVAQAAQVTLTLSSVAPVAAGVAVVVEGLCSVTTALANIPAAVMFAAVATLVFTRRAFPRWLGWITVLCALASVLSAVSVTAADGPLAPTGWLTTVARLVPALFYLPAAVLLLLMPRGDDTT